MREDTKNIKKKIVSGLIISPNKMYIKKTYNGFEIEIHYRKSTYKMYIYDTLYNKYILLEIDGLLENNSFELNISIEYINNHIKARYNI